MKNGLVSVIMGIYNIPSYEMLEKAINSILNQTYKNIEFIIIDDGSSNETFKWAKKITKNDKRVILKKNDENKGLTKTLNECLKLANGEYIARMDGDDYCDLSRIEKQVNYLQNNKNVSLVSCSSYLFDDTGIWGERILKSSINKKDFLFTNPIIHPSIMTYKKCYEIAKGYHEIWYTDRNEDYDLFMRMYSNGVKMENLSEKLYFFREDKNSVKRRKYKFRINEAFVRMNGYFKLKLFPIGFLYVIKPLIIGLFPGFVMRKIQKQKYGDIR